MPSGLPPFFLFNTIYHRPFGGGQGAFEVAAVFGGGFRAGEMNSSVPDGSLSGRGMMGAIQKSYTE